MQALEHNQEKPPYNAELEQLKQVYPNLRGETWEIYQNHEQHTVEIKIGRDQHVMTAEQARKMALQLKIAAHRVEKKAKKERK